jgi:O-antigen ligase
MTSHHRHHRSHSRNREVGRAVPFWADRTGVSPAVFLLSCAVFVIGLIFGGTVGSFGDAVTQFLALPLMVLAAMNWSRSGLQGPDWAALIIIAGIGVLACVQLVPLPMSVWSALPARAGLLRDMQSVGVTPLWRSLSLNPYATERALLWSLPAIAMFLAVRWMSPAQRRMLLVVLFFGALALMVLTVVQHTAAQGNVVAAANETIAKATLALNPQPFSVAPPAAAESVIGGFSNHNHFATFLAMTIPMVIAMGLRSWFDRGRDQSKSSFIWASFLILVMVGLLIGMIQTHSRAALVLGGIALLGSLALLRGLGLSRRIIRWVAGVTFVGVLLAIQMAASATLERLDRSLDTEVRWKIHATTVDAAHHFGPMGSGLGTFVEAYQQVPPEEGFWPKYINHAHGDYHELWLETGVPGAVLVLCFIGWFGWSSWRAWNGSNGNAARTLVARAASLSILMVVLHSYLDYPMRRTAILVVFGMACALMTPTEAAPAQRLERTRRKRVVVAPPPPQPTDEDTGSVNGVAADAT